MALLNYLLKHAKEYNLTLSAVNCDHTIRGEASASDSAFVLSECKRLGIPLLTFIWEEYALGTITASVEEKAREWRHECYLKASKPHALNNGEIWQGADVIALAHHANDNVETVLFNLMRGTSASGLVGIRDELLTVNGENLSIVRPLIEWTRADIDSYVEKENIAYVVDESNLSNDYTRNQIRNTLIPTMQEITPTVVDAISRFSSLCARDEEYFLSVIEKQNLITFDGNILHLKRCEELAVFSRACVYALKKMQIKDYTLDIIERLYDLQFKQKGKRFGFLHLTAINEEGKIVLYPDLPKEECEIAPFEKYALAEVDEYYAQPLMVVKCAKSQANMLRASAPYKTLYIDADKVPKGAVVRFLQAGDTFKKFCGGTKSLGDFFTDKKIPQRKRTSVPLIAYGNEILCVCGVEIADKVKLDDKTQSVYCITAKDYTAE